MSVYSYDQLVLEHRVNPEEVLLNLGFVKQSNSDTGRIPDHFLLYQSKAKGITPDHYLDDNPKVQKHLEQKLALENAFRAVNQPPASPVSSHNDDNSEGQSVDFVGHLKDKFESFVCRSVGREGNTGTIDDAQSVSVSNDMPGKVETVCFEGDSLRCLKSVTIATLSALFADDRLPLRYLQSLMCRLTTGHSPRQAALTFDGFALSWLWKLDSDSLSSYWLPSTDLNSLSLLQQSIPTDNWSMQPPTAADWSARPPAGHDWSVQLPSADVDQLFHSADFLDRCSLLPALQRPLSNILPATNDCFLEFPDQSQDLTDGREFQTHGGVFCDCCCQHLVSGTSSTSKSWDQLETVDFFIEDGAETLAGYCQWVGDSSKNVDSDKDCDIAHQDKDDVCNYYLLTTCADVTETLV